MVTHARGLCRICGKNRVFIDEEKKLCRECSDKLKAGEYTQADIIKRVQGRKVQILLNKKKKAAEELPAVDEEESSLHEKKTEKTGKPHKVYRCEHCHSKVGYAQQKCTACGGWLSWLGTAAETDPDIIICPSCGTALGTAAKHADICPKCNYGA